MPRHHAAAFKFATALIAGLATLVVPLSTAARAQTPAATPAPEKPQAPATRALTIGITSGSPPYVFSVEQKDGMDLDILGAIVTRMGRTPAFVHVPFARRSLVLASHKVDAVTFWTMPKGVTCTASAPYRYWRNALFTLRPKGAKAAGKAADAPKRMGIFMGSEHMRGLLADMGINYDSLQRIYTVNAGVRMMLYGRLDAYIGDYPTAIYNFKKEDPKGEYEPRIEHFFPPAPQRLCFTDSAEAKAFNTARDTLLTENPDALRAITRRHGLTEQITPPLDE